MFDKPSAFTLVGAVLGASAYAQPLPAAAQEPMPAQAVENIQRARVAIYCGHRLEAVADLRAASQQLRAAGVQLAPGTLAALDKAVWLARRNDHVQAEQSLDTVLAQLAVDAHRT